MTVSSKLDLSSGLLQQKGHGFEGVPTPGEEHRDVLWRVMDCKEAVACLSACLFAFSILWLLDPPQGFFQHSVSCKSTHCICSHSLHLSQTPKVTPSRNSWCSRSSTSECQYAQVHRSPPLLDNPPPQYLGILVKEICFLGLLPENALLAVLLLAQMGDYVGYDMRRGVVLDGLLRSWQPSRVSF